MKLLLSFCFTTLTTFSSYGQCISLKEMRAFFFKDVEARENFVDARNFRVNSVDAMGIIWKKSTGNTFFVVDFDESGKAWMVSYQMDAAKSCYDLLRAEVSSLGLHKDEQFYVGDSFVTCYSNSKYGVIIEKGSFNGKVKYDAKVISKPKYYEQIAEEKP